MAHLTEVLVAETVDCFQSLPLQDLDEQWFNDLWINKFSTLEEYPSSGSEIFTEGLFEPILTAIELCEKWIEKSCESSANADNTNDSTVSSEEVLWTVFMDNDIDIRYVLAFLYAVCSRGMKIEAKKYEKEMALKCAKLYFTLLRIPGNKAYSVYSPSLFQLAFDCLKFPKEKVLGKKRPPTSAYRNDIVSKRKRTHRDDSFSESPEEPLTNDDYVATEEHEFSEQECNELLLQFIDVLKTVIPLFQTFSLSGNFELIENIMRKLSECVAVELHHSDLNFLRSVEEICHLQRRNGVQYVVTALGYCAYLNLCQPLHGDVDEIYRLCLQSLCGHILCSKAKSQPNQAISHKYLVIRDNALAFVRHNLKEHLDYSAEVTRILIQRLCMRCLDKTDYRAKVSFAIIEILKILPLKPYVEMMDWFVRFVTQKPQDKMIVLEIFALLIEASEREITQEIVRKWEVYATHIPIVCSIIERCDDKAPTVRAKALSVLTGERVLKRVIEVIKEGKRNFVLPPEKGEESDGDSEMDDEDSEKDDEENVEEEKSSEMGEDEEPEEGGAEKDEDVGTANEDAVNGEEEKEAEEAAAPVQRKTKKRQPCISQFQICSVEKLIELLLVRAVDLKVHVRKAALQAIEHLLCLDETYFNERFLIFLSRATRDPNVTVRKSSVSSLTKILYKYYDNRLVQKTWMKSVLPIVLDAEKSVQSKGLDEMEPILLLDNRSSSTMKHCSWAILHEIAIGDHNDLLRYLHKAYGIWKAEGKLKPNLSKILEAELGTHHESAAWMLLAILASNVEIKNITSIINRWEQSCGTNIENSTMLRMLLVLGHTCKHLKPDQLQNLRNTLENHIRSFDCNYQAINTTMETLYKVYRAQSRNDDGSTKLMNHFASEVIQVLLEKFNNIERQILRAIVGKNYVCDILPSEFRQPAESFLSDIVMGNNPSGEYSDDLICQYLQTVGEIAILAPASVPERMLLILQSIIASTSTSDVGVNDEALASARSTNGIWRQCPKIQAFAFTTLGKLCLTNEKYPESCMPVFIRELSVSKSFIVRMNIMTVLADLCVRYTLMVDLYIPSISVCLKDANVNIRCQTLALISRLLQEDYIKLKETLLFRLLAVVGDEDEDMRNMVEYCLANLIIKKKPTIFADQFVQCIFYFNANSPNPNMKNVLQKQDIRLFSLKGDHNFEKRMAIYKFMANHTPQAKRSQIIIKLATDILRAVAKRNISLDEDGVEDDVKDCLAVLSLEELKPSHGHANNADDNEETESTESALCKDSYRSAIVFAIIPIAITLKKTLTELKSRLMNNVLRFIAEICKDYKSEVKDLFATNQDIIEEIEYITKKYEKEQEKKRRINIENKDTDDSETESEQPRTRPKTSANDQLNRTLIDNGIDPTRSPVILLTRLNVTGDGVNVADYFSDQARSARNGENQLNGQRRMTGRRHITIHNARTPLSETAALNNEQNIAMGNITICDIGNTEWNDSRRSMNVSRASTHHPRNAET